MYEKNKLKNMKIYMEQGSYIVFAVETGKDYPNNLC